jgi:dTDP-4-amino-4,6-dideoxygalactose transaminase
MQAALGLSQLERLDEFVRQRHQLAARYDELLSGLPISLPWCHPDCYSAFHLYPVRINSALARQGRREVFEYMQADGIGVNVHYIPVHTQPYYQDFGFRQGDFPEAERYYLEALSLPLFPGLGAEEQDRVVDALARAVK